MAEIQAALRGVPGIMDADVKILLPEAESEGDPFAHRRPIPGVGTTIAVASGKGGVGKSVVAVNLALALAETGAQVGLLDADIYGPNIPLMLGVAEPPMAVDGRYIPVRKHGLRVMSMGLLAGASDPVIWRGALVMEMARKFLWSVFWGGVDHLVVDLPPGTGDVQLTLVQEIVLSGAVIVTTPSDVALLDARKGLEMFRRTGVPVLGIVENMSRFACPACGHESWVFGRGQGRRIAEALEVPLLGEIPLDEEIRKAGDLGRPLLLANPEAPQARYFREIAQRVLAALP
jgi:ATP-binding protein involved in chromosome partitioning